MKKIVSKENYLSRALLHFVRLTKTSAILLLLGIGNAYSVTYSQVTLLSFEVKNKPIEKVLDLIEDKSEYVFFFSDEIKSELKNKVSIQVNDATLDKILDDLFKNTDLSYVIHDRQVTVIRVKADGNKTRLSGTEMQQQNPTVTGKVVDASGEPLIGVSVVIQGTTTGVITDVNGYYSIRAASGNTLVFSYVGYKNKTEAVQNRAVINVVLTEDVQLINEVVVVGYGTQTKATLTGAVSSIKSDDLISTKNENVQNMLTGKMPGVRVTQRTAEPGAFNNNLDIRGMGSPLVVIDDVPRTMAAFQRLDPNDVESISVLKDASAAIYGVRAANGVILVTTKQGADGVIRLDYSGAYTAQVPSGLPATLDAVDYMTIRNERNMHNLSGGSLIYEDSRFDEYLSGQKQSTDWYSHVFGDYAPQTQHSLNARGGTDRIKYYTGIGYLYQEGFLKSSDLNYERYNIRANVEGKITDRLTAKLNLNLTMDEQNRPYQDSWWIIRGFWRQNPLMPVYAVPEQTMMYHGLIEGDNPVSFMNADLVGNRKYNQKMAESTGILEYRIPGIDGLTAKAMLSYDFGIRDSKEFQKEYDQYRYDEASNTYNRYTRQSPQSIRRESYMESHLLSHVSLKYKHTFVDVHKVEGLLAWETNRYDADNFSAKRNLALPLPYLFAGVAEEQLATMNTGGLYINANNALLGRIQYGYADRYLIDALFRYDGSSKFAPGKQWGFFPGVSAGWRISEEAFFKESPLAFIQQLKLRASYGITGDDSASSYQFISGYNYPSGTDRRNFTGGYVFGGNFVASADNKGIPNPAITWYTAKMFNAGIDFDAWGKFGLTVEYFNRDRSGLLATRNGGIPTVVGASLPQENLNGDRTFGMELDLYYRDHVGDFTYKIEGIAQITRTKRLYVERGAIGSSWSNWKNNQNNRLQGVHNGYQGAGRFESWEQIWSHPVYTGRSTLIGDYIYEDWNGDGQIDGNDSHPIRFNQYPWTNFSLIFNGTYKSFDFDMLWQGATMTSLIYGEQLREPLWGSGESSAMAQFMDRWHLVDPKADPYDPTQQWVSGYFANTGTLPDENSTFNAEDGTYLRLKSVEVGYTLPRFLGINELRIFANAYNLLTFTKIRYVDPEHPNDTYGYLYPLNKSYTLGLNIRF